MPYKATQISITQTGRFSGLFVDYIHRENKLRKFYTYQPEIDSFKNIMNDRSKLSINRKVLVEVLKDQYKRLNVKVSGSLPGSNIDLLLQENTFTVCTGHQLCLFSGPLYFIYKIISTINLSEELKKKYPEKNFVPVYWMASEDHDFDEVSSVNIFGKTISWDLPGAKGAVGRLSTGGLKKMIDEIRIILGDSGYSKELLELFENAYLNYPNLADATRYLVHQLFSEFGLVILDPDDKRLKTEFLEIIKDDIVNQTNFRIVTESIEKLQSINIKPQVNPREINVFHLNGDRKRIENANDDVLDLSPEQYSPNVVLRPLYQQLILPNLAYVGGPGEIAYWLEYKSMFEHHGILFPVLIPRNFALLVDQKTVQQMEKLNLDFMDLFKDQDLLIREFIAKQSGTEISLNDQAKAFKELYDSISEKVAAIDPTLKGSVEAERQKALNALNNIESKILRSEKQKQEVSINQIKKILEKSFPDNMLQERYENFAPYYLKYGRSFIKELKETFDPFEFKLLIIELN